jgi:hypothetical protein
VRHPSAPVILKGASTGTPSGNPWLRTADGTALNTTAFLAESQIGLYKAELIRSEGPWRDVEHVESETLNYVDWFNTERPQEFVDDLTPVRVEKVHYAARNRLRPTG